MNDSVERLTVEEYIDSLLTEIERLRAEIERLTKENAELEKDLDIILKASLEEK